MALITLLDGYVDEPSMLGVPPYISPYVRGTAGAVLDSGHRYEYITIDSYRSGRRPKGELLVVISGAMVPGRYLRGMPASMKEMARIFSEFSGQSVLVGPTARYGKDEELRRLGPDFTLRGDPAAGIYDLLNSGTETRRRMTMEEWNRWLLMGAGVVKEHPDFPDPLIAEIETSRGCVRYLSGGCAFCTEPLFGRPVFREPEDIVAEASALSELGVKRFRLGGQACIFSYMADGVGKTERPVPNSDVMERLFSGLHALKPEVLHADNANPAIIAEHPEESEKVAEIIVKYSTPGNTLSFGMESADPTVIEANNLNATADEVLAAIRIINRVGAKRGRNGMPQLLPGLNFIAGLRGETPETYNLNMEFLKKVADEGLFLRRINIRQIAETRGEFPGPIRKEFMRFKTWVRENIDRPMLVRMIPQGTVMRDVYLELNRGGITFGRQVGSYPILVGLPYAAEINRFVDVIITGHGQKSITGVEYPVDINTASMAQLQAVPGIGRKRAARIVRGRPWRSAEEMIEALELDDMVAKDIKMWIAGK